MDAPVETFVKTFVHTSVEMTVERSVFFYRDFCVNSSKDFYVILLWRPLLVTFVENSPSETSVVTSMQTSVDTFAETYVKTFGETALTLLRSLLRRKKNSLEYLSGKL